MKLSYKRNRKLSKKNIRRTLRCGKGNKAVKEGVTEEGEKDDLGKLNETRENVSGGDKSGVKGTCANPSRKKATGN